jgi:glycosyltransferase involved in cell wall biosynthesis
MNKNSLISVIIPVYNCDRYLGEAIQSVLDQTYQPLEIIIIDDGSTDRSADVAKSFSPTVQYYFQPNGGLGHARNAGIKLATGNFFAFLDADDLWVENKLSHQIAAFDNDPTLDVIFGLVKQFISPELDENIQDKIHCPPELMPGYIAGTMLIKREAFFRVGLFNTHLKLGEFIDWYIKVTEQGLKSSILPEVLLKRRIHDANMGISERKSRTDYVRILKASLDRRRAKGQNI